jgi:hypothetical protein
MRVLIHRTIHPTLTKSQTRNSPSNTPCGMTSVPEVVTTEVPARSRSNAPTAHHSPNRIRRRIYIEFRRTPDTFGPVGTLRTPSRYSRA